MPLKGLQLSRYIFQIPTHRRQAVHRCPTSVSSVSRSLSSHSLFQHSQRIKTACRASPSIFQSGATAQASRFSSTASAASTASMTSISSGATEPVAAPFKDYNASSIEEITSDPPSIPETIGYLKDLGLDFGWGPTALVEYLLEHIHVYTATPWWASIILTALFVRLALLKPYINASDTSARLAAIAEVQKPMQARINAARASRDSTKVGQSVTEMRALHRQAGIKWGTMLVPLLQAPIGYGSFRLIHRMTELPVPGLEDGGLLWVKDLTISDPFYILPALTSLGIYYTVKAGGEYGNNMMNPGMAKFMLYGMPMLGGGFMLLYPAAFQLTVGFTSMLSLIQAYVLREPWVRRRLGIYPLPERKPVSTTPKAVVARLNMYQPPSQALAAPKVESGIAGKAKEKMSEAKGAASELMKSVNSLRGSTPKNANRSLSASPEVGKAQALQQRRLNRLAQARPKQ
ncbi:MAG: hypothetical protein Q9195_004288 [Heterodermia aff. obscurata]